MLPGKKFTPQVIIGIVLRRWWMLAAPALVGLFVGLLVASKVQDSFKSEMLIQIVPQQVPDRFIPNTVTERTEDRMESLQAQVKSRSQLEPLIREFQLYPEMLSVAPMEDVVNRMRSAIDVELLRPNRMAPPNAFYIRFTYNDADKAAKVTSRLGGIFVDKNSDERVKTAESTSEFLQSQLSEAKSRLEAHEQKMEQFRQRHSGRLPSQADFNLQAIQTTQMNLQAVIESAARDRDRKMMLERLYQEALNEPAPPSIPIASAPQNAAAASSLPLAQQLELARTNLAGLEMRLRDTHPDVKRARDLVAELTRRVADEAANTTPAAPAAAPLTQQEAQRNERLRQMGAEIESISRQLTWKEGEERRLRGIVSDYQARLEGTPGIESEWIALTRDYETLTTSYRDLLQKSENSKVAANLERRNVGEQFRVLDPARVPVLPVGPMRLQINAIGFGVGLALGLLVVGLLEFRDTTFRSESDVMDALALPVLALVPLVQTAADVRRLRRLRLTVAGCVLAAAASAAAVFWRLQLWQHLV